MMRKRQVAHPLQKDIRVAIVEEISDDIYSMKFVLQSLGYEVLSFAASSVYIEPLLRFNPKIVIVDMMIPAEGGYHVIEQINSQTSVKFAILAITAAGMRGNEGDVLEAGVSKILSKPYTIAELQEKLNEMGG